jgi:hypothetical protein
MKNEEEENPFLNAAAQEVPLPHLHPRPCPNHIAVSPDVAPLTHTRFPAHSVWLKQGENRKKQQQAKPAAAKPAPAKGGKK